MTLHQFLQRNTVFIRCARLFGFDAEGTEDPVPIKDPKCNIGISNIND